MYNYPVNIPDEDKDILGNKLGDAMDELLSADNVIDCTQTLLLIMTLAAYCGIKNGINLDPILKIAIDSEEFGWDPGMIRKRIDYELRNQTVDGSFN
jgi:hypothetical protein